MSPAIKRNDLFFAVYFILVLRYPSLHSKLQSELVNHINQIDQSLSIAQPDTGNTHATRETRETSKKTKEIGPDDQKINQDLTPQEIYDYWIYDAEIIVDNDNVIVAKFEHQDQWYAIKCCDMYNSPMLANNELKNEAIVLSYIQENFSGKVKKMIKQTSYLFESIF